METELPHNIGITPALQHLLLLRRQPGGPPFLKLRLIGQRAHRIEMTDAVGGKFPHLRFAFLLHQREEAGEVPDHEPDLERGTPGGESRRFFEQLLRRVAVSQVERRLKRGVKAVIVRRRRQLGLPVGIDGAEFRLLKRDAAHRIAAEPDRAETVQRGVAVRREIDRIARAIRVCGRAECRELG